MAMEITNNYNSYAAQSMAGSGAASDTKKKETEYAKELAKLVPSVEFKVGNSFGTAKSGKTLTVNPQLLEKMQNDPATEKEMKELIKGVELAVNRLDSSMKAIGWTVVYKHCYIDENGKCRSIAYLRNDFMLNLSDKLRKERKKNSEELIEKAKEKTAEKKEKLEEILEEKIADSKDGTIYLNDTDIQTIIEAAKEDDAGKNNVKEQPQAGTNLDLKI